MSQDNGSWLSAEQAVMPDGSERHNLPLVKKKLPQFSPEQAAHAEPIPEAPERPATSPATPDQG
ncbi:hypothetical protein [Herbaspirillum sp. NPDC087042]|uniref:hypothetical protein n=1 Tax=Herbaspirillum sp. NPDC087042 TaxID=3364004 RepID=UPI003829D17C